VRVEVEYPEERDGTKVWDETGEAVEINFLSDPPTLMPLLPYDIVTP